MPAIRSLLLLLLLPALLLPEGVPVCLHFLLCREQATSGCCQRDRCDEGSGARVAAPQADCCVAAPGACLLPVLARDGSDSADSACASAPEPSIDPDRAPFGGVSRAERPPPQATESPPAGLAPPLRVRFAETALPLRL
jgi:hypothetical protein